MYSSKQQIGLGQVEDPQNPSAEIDFAVLYWPMYSATL
jgi:hypothetical protein